MADFEGTTPSVGAASGSCDPAGATTPLVVPEVVSTLRFLMRAYRPGSDDFETWIAVGVPNNENPSGQPIENLTVQASWFVE